MRRTRARHASCSLLLLQTLPPLLHPVSLSLFPFGSDCEFKKQKKKKQNKQKKTKRNRTFGARRSPRCGWRMELTGLFPPPWRTLGSGHLVPALGRRVWIYLLFFCCFFFPCWKQRRLFFFCFFFFHCWKQMRLFFLSLSFIFFFFLFYFLNGVGCFAGIPFCSQLLFEKRMQLSDML